MDLNRFCIEENEARRKQWAYLTEGIDNGSRQGKQKRLTLEALLDQEKKWLEEANTTANIGAFTTYAFPMVRRIFPKLISQNLVSVQPLSQPTGKVFFLDFKYGSDSAVGDARVGDRLDQVKDKTYADSSEAAAIKEVNFNIYSEDVSAKEKKLKAKWTIESQQDLKAYHGINAEDELMAVCSDEVIREIDIELIEDVAVNATAGNVNWDINAPAIAPWTALDPKIYKATLYDAIVDANNLIFKKRYRNATWLVADADTCTRLEKLEGFKLTETVDDAVFNVGIHEFGVLRNRWTIYKHPWFTENQILVGFKGASWLETGYVYCPYIPLYTTPLFVDPDDMQLKRAMMSRYAKKSVIGDMYATVTLRAS